MDELTIGKIADLADVGVETIRFYERKGLIAQPNRRKSQYRRYPPQTIARLQFIKRAQALGFSLKQIHELLDLRFDSNTICGDIRTRAEQKLIDIGGKIQTLERMKTVLEKLTASCDAELAVDQCPILEAMDHEEILP